MIPLGGVLCIEYEATLERDLRFSYLSFVYPAGVKSDA